MVKFYCANHLATTETFTGLREKIEQLIIEIDVVRLFEKINQVLANKSIINDLISLDLQIIEILKEIYEIGFQ